MEEKEKENFCNFIQAVHKRLSHPLRGRKKFFMEADFCPFPVSRVLPKTFFSSIAVPGKWFLALLKLF
ncbi:MAG: hypothetical protein WCR16_02750 [Bacilli bacterium]